MPLPLEEIFAMLPQAWQARAFRWLVISTVAVWLARKFLIPLLAWASDITAAKWDNVLVLKLSNMLDAAATWLDTTLRIAPRVSLGPSPAQEPITTRSSRRPPPLMVPPPIGVPPPVGDRATLPELAETLQAQRELAAMAQFKSLDLDLAKTRSSFDDPQEVTKAERISAKASQRPQEPGSTPGGGSATP